MSTNDPAKIEKILKGYEAETRAIIDNIRDICWYMRGGMTREEAWTLSFKERESVMKLIEENIKRVNDTRLPLL